MIGWVPAVHTESISRTQSGSFSSEQAWLSWMPPSALNVTGVSTSRPRTTADRVTSLMGRIRTSVVES